MNTFLQDFRYALRMLIKNPAITVITIITLAVGIAANTTIFSVIDALVFRPVPFENLDRIMTIWTIENGRLENREGVAPADYFDWKEQNMVFDHLAALREADINITGGGEPEYVEAAQVTSNFFDVLGIKASEGRLFLPEENEPGNDRVAIVSHLLWQRRFNGDPSLIGSTLTLNDENTTVIGILPADHQYPVEQDLWLPLALTTEERGDRTKKSLNVVGRLKASVSEAQAQAAMSTIMSRVSEQYPLTHGNQTVLISTLLAEYSDEITYAFSFTLFGAVAFVLLIACANVMNLQLARATGRYKEIAIRTALGANRWRVVRQLLTESILLACMAGFFGAMIALWGIDVIKAVLPQNMARFVPMWNHMGLDDRTLLFTSVIVIITGIVSGLAPAIQASRPNLNDALTDSARGSSGGKGRKRLRSGLVVSEVALALILLVGAGLMIQGFIGMLNKDIGIDSENILTMRITLPEEKYPEAHLVNSFYQQAYEQLKTIPGVESVGGANFLHADNSWDNVPVVIEGRPALQPSELPRLNRHIINDSYLSTMRIPLLQGRLFSEGDDTQSASVVMISNSMAQRYFPNQDPVGQRIKIGISSGFDGEPAADGPWRTIVGVVQDASYMWFDRQPRETVFLPALQASRRWMNIVIRTSSDPLEVTPQVRTLIAGLDPGQGVADIKTMEKLIDDRLVGVRLSAGLMGVFGVVALIMAAVGIYSVMAYSVAQRTHEIGIRMAIGARQKDVLVMVMRQALVLAGIGLLIGLPIAYGLSIMVQEGIGAALTIDTSTFVIFSAILILVATLSSFIPGHRATRIDPMIALRYE